MLTLPEVRNDQTMPPYPHYTPLLSLPSPLPSPTPLSPPPRARAPAARCVGVDEDVFGFEVTVDDADAVEVCETLSEVHKVLENVLLC